MRYPASEKLEIIQLVEVPAPARRFASSPIDSSSIASSSSSCYSSESESEYSSDDDEAESAGSSYCSSDSSEQINSEEEEEVSKPDETYDTRATRVHAWRASFAKDTGIASSDILPIQHTKRKIADNIEIDEDDGSHSSKRSRPYHARSTSALTTHTCAACDASFSTRQILRQHGEAQANEACRIAVEYDFE